MLLRLTDPVGPQLLFTTRFETLDHARERPLRPE